MELVTSFVVTWSIILVPPIGLRVMHRTFFSKSSAIAVALLLFVLNHIVFAVMTERQSLRPFLAVGAFVTFVILRWQTRASAADAAMAERRALGYPTEPPTASAMPPAPNPRSMDRRVVVPAYQAKLPLRGWLRVGIVAATCWLVVVAGRVAYELDGQASTRLLVDRVDYKPDLEIVDFVRVERNLRKALEDGPTLRSPPVEPVDQSSTYAQILDEEMRTRDARVVGQLPDTTAVPFSPQQAKTLAQELRLPVEAVLRAPSDAQQLRALIELRAAMNASPMLQYQVLGYKSPTYRPRLWLIAIAVLAPLLALVSLWATVMWIVNGFRSEA
jgi:hypothetical protein